MRNLLLWIQYRGTRYHGFQVQDNARSVAGTVQDAVERVFEGRLDIKGCSRTDAGVHARRFALTLRTQRPIPCDAVVRAMNVNLPGDIAVLDCHEVPEAFHPRYSCQGKRYCYRVWNAPSKNAFLEDLALHWKYPLDLAAMDKAAHFFVGTHDFTAFSSAGRKPGDPVREIFEAGVTREGDMIAFSIKGNGFLYNMVRIMMGTLLEVSRGSIQPDSIPSVLESRDRAGAGFTAPPHGLYLEEVYYSRLPAADLS